MRFLTISAIMPYMNLILALLCDTEYREVEENEIQDNRNLFTGD